MAKTQEIIGGYALEAELGRGGMGLVYQARHPEHGVVALKRLQPFPKAFASQSLRSEIRMLSMLNHPGVVKLIDHGMEERGPWMAMEYIRGRSLSDHLSEGPASVPISGRASTNHVIRLPGTLDAGDTLASTMTTIPQPFTAFSGIVFEEDPKSPRTPATEEVAQQRLRWLHQVCQALSYIHGQGIVHADLKPGNILITSTGRVVLVDFGLATQFGSRVQVEALLRAGLLAGSLAYISPEQCRGEPLDARADLYAVGCILCELLTGSPPFGHQRSDLSLMNHHIHTPPPSLGQLVSPQPETWSPLETLMDELLAKQPEQRPGFAQVVLRAVENVGVGISGDRTLEGRPYLHKAPLVGRQQLFGCLVEAFREALRGRGKWVLLRGESGVGKTRLMQELVRVARRLDAVVWVGYSSGEGLGSPLGLFVPILRAIADRCVQMGPEYTAGVFRSYAMAVLAPYAPFLRALPGIEGVASGTLARLPVESARLRLFTCLVEVLRRSSEEYASLIVLDDLQWADVLSLDALKFMGQELGRLPWLVVGTTRVEEWSGSALEQMSEGCSSEVLEVFEVERLHRESAVQMIGQMLGHPPDPDLSNALLVRAGTNPFFIAEYLRAAVVSGLLQLDRGGRWRVAE
ncbi:MAG: protein kinase, partial [Myxococcota bacterium]